MLLKKCLKSFESSKGSMISPREHFVNPGMVRILEKYLL